jgi:hypothetical protein
MAIKLGNKYCKICKIQIHLTMLTNQMFIYTKLTTKCVPGILATTYFIIFRLPYSTQTSKKLYVSQFSFIP